MTGTDVAMALITGLNGAHDSTMRVIETHTKNLSGVHDVDYAEIHYAFFRYFAFMSLIIPIGKRVATEAEIRELADGTAKASVELARTGSFERGIIPVGPTLARKMENDDFPKWASGIFFRRMLDVGISAQDLDHLEKALGAPPAALMSNAGIFADTVLFANVLRILRRLNAEAHPAALAQTIGACTYRYNTEIQKRFS